MELYKIVLTGGPCAGKTTARSWIQNSFERLGYRVLFIPEAYTDLSRGGICEEAFARNVDFQLSQFWMQLENERVYERAARLMNTDKVLIVCDRGSIDNKPYMSAEEFQQILSQLNTSEEELRDDYDAVFHMVTAAQGAEEYYTLANNEARTESPEEAIVLDKQLISAWEGHRYMRIIDNSGSGFEEKLLQLLCEIRTFLGEPLSRNYHRRFLIEMPDAAALEKLPNCRRVDMVQTFLKSEPGRERRISCRKLDGISRYYRTEKNAGGTGKQIETEKRLTRDEYTALLMSADPKLRPVRKSRYYIAENNEYFEIDIYPFWADKAVLEVDLNNPEDSFQIPEFVKVLEEITDNAAYNYPALAKL